MKAKIIKTGEIVEVYHEPQHGQTTNIYKEAVLVNGRMWEEDELDFPINSKSEDERIRKYLISFVELNSGVNLSPEGAKIILAWLEKRGSEPNWCHHKVDLSNCSEEYRKAYYDGWNNCNQQHSQCKSEWKNAVDGICISNGAECGATIESPAGMLFLQRNTLDVGDKVKIIIVRED